VVARVSQRGDDDEPGPFETEIIEEGDGTEARVGLSIVPHIDAARRSRAGPSNPSPPSVRFEIHRDERGVLKSISGLRSPTPASRRCRPTHTDPPTPLLGINPASPNRPHSGELRFPGGAGVQPWAAQTTGSDEQRWHYPIAT
jgi:hypothetical protein